MAEENVSFSMGWAGKPPRKESATRYLSVPFEARAIDGGDVLLLPAGDSHPQRIAMQLAQVLASCEGLQSLDAHARQVAQRLQLPPQQAAALHQPLQQLVELGLLLDEAGLVDRLGARQPAGDPASIDLLFVRTCARPKTLARLLESLAGQPSDCGPKYCIVIDDATDDADQAATREVVERAAPSLSCELRLVDRAGRERLLDTIARASGADRERLGWHLDGERDDDRKTYGAGPNLALLLAAGRRFALMDDDATFHGSPAPGATATPVFTPESRSRTQFPGNDADGVGERMSRLAEHPLAAHARYLGRSAGALVALAGDDARSTLDHLTSQLLFELLSQPRVRFTCSGVAGDPGTEDLHWLFAGEPEDLRPLCTESADAGHRQLFGRRIVRCPRQPEASTAFALMTTTLTGIDNRELMLPTAARGRNEDMLCGALAGYLYPGSLQMGLPHALEHDRASPRHWSEEALDHPRRPDRGRYLFAWLEELGGVVHSTDASTRIAVLKSALTDLAREDEAGVRSRMARHLVDIQGSLVERLEQVRRTLNPPDWLNSDFERVIRSSAGTAPDLEQRLSDEARATQVFAAGYAAALDDWCLAWRHCRDQTTESLLTASQAVP